MEAHIGVPFYATVEFGASKAGLLTVGYVLKNPNGSIYRSRVSTGITDLGGGSYGTHIVISDPWQGTIVWDTGDSIPRTAIEDIEVVPSPSARIASANRNTFFNEFIALVKNQGSDFLYHRDDSQVPCPCLTPEGFRDPEWHLANPSFGECNPSGMLQIPNEFWSKGFVQPIQSTRATRLSAETLQAMFGGVQMDDHLGIFPMTWQGRELDFFNWGQATEDWVEFQNRKFQVVNANLIPDPDGEMNHWEVGLRLIRR